MNKMCLDDLGVLMSYLHWELFYKAPYWYQEPAHYRDEWN